MAYPNYGLMGDMASGIKEGMIAYHTNQQMQRSNQLQNLLTGVQPDENGQLQFTPERQTEIENERKAKGLLAQHQMDMFNEESPISKQYTQAFKSNGLQVPDHPTASTLKELMPLYSTKMKSDASSKLAGARLDLSANRFDEQQNKNAGQVGMQFENQLAPYKKVNNSLDRALSLLNGNTPLTATSMNMAKQDLANAVAPGGAATEGKVSRELIDSYMEKLNQFEQRAGAVKDIRKQEPELVGNLRDMTNQIKEDWSSAMARQAEDVHDSYKYNTNEKVKDTIKDKLMRYAPKSYEERYGGGSSKNRGLIQSAQQGQASTHPQDSAAVEWANANPKDPRSAAILKANGK